MARTKRATAKTAATTTSSPAAVPAPSAKSAEWYPVHVRLPDGTELGRRCKAYTTPEGLYVYTEVPAGGDPAKPAWFSPITPGQTKPPTGWRARNGFTIDTAAGTVALTADGGCGCGSPLKRWVPQFSRKVVAW
jgi:hypothetical protein